MPSLFPEDLRSIASFKRLEDRIYELAGNQQLIDRKVAFINMMLAALQLEQRMQRINVGELKEAWHDCSQLCHIEWSLLVDSPMAVAVGEEAFGIISKIQLRVRAIVDGGVSWFRVADASFADLQERYVRGDIDEANVMVWFAERGLWSTITDPDGSSRVVGVPIAPQGS